MRGFMKKLFAPRISSEKWFKKASRADVEALRDSLHAIFMDPTRDQKLREQIHRYLDYLDKVINKKR